MIARAATGDLERSARAFHALSDVTRLRIVDLLRGGERCVCDLTGALGAGQSRLSFHLRILKEAGVVLDRKQGRWVYYRLNPDQVDRLAGALNACCAPGTPWLKGCCQ
ncbi:MAG TPA: metalloregulator ArsR/SmtB family transcription factor [Gemmatimonadales bacterium]|nr:metalloregulator ArsR/SmtB family transcription factor [Gemmatimonadales bacterium]